jgi:hypothetical protein
MVSEGGMKTVHILLWILAMVALGVMALHFLAALGPRL